MWRGCPTEEKKPHRSGDLKMKAWLKGENPEQDKLATASDEGE